MRVSGSFKLLACLAVVAFALGCSQGSSPTEPMDSSTAQVAAAEGGAEPVVIERGDDGSVEARRPAGHVGLTPAVERPAAVGAQGAAGAATPLVAEARGGNGNGGNGHGNGGNGNGGHGNGGNGGNGGGGNGGRGGELKLDLHPDTWNTNWEHAEGNLQAFVRGKDAKDIDPSSVELSSEGGDTVTPRSVRINGGQLVATFSKSEAFESLADPETGDRIEVTLSFKVGDAAEATKLTDDVRIVGPSTGGGEEGEEEEGELELKISPDDWNVNWQRSNGQVHAFLRGPDAELDKVDLDSIRLIGDDATAAPVEPLDVRRVGHQIVARFSKKEAWKSLDDPDAGETHTVKIKFLSDATETELSDQVQIVGR